MRKYTLKEDYFDKIDSSDKAYFLGLLYADGYNCTKRGFIRLTLHDKDINILIKLNKLLIHSKPIYKEKNKPHSIIYISSRYMSNRLVELGCGGIKTFNLKFPSWLNENLYNDFIRGYFDGDGTIYYNKANKNFRVELIGTDSFIGSIQDIMCNKLGFSKTKLYKKPKHIESGKNISSLIIGSTNQARKFKEWIYSDANLYLERKYNKFKEII